MKRAGLIRIILGWAGLIRESYVCTVDLSELDFVEWLIKVEETLDCGKFKDKKAMHVKEALLLRDTNKVRELLLSDIPADKRGEIRGKVNLLIWQWFADHQR
jgi:hypothetical protein